MTLEEENIAKGKILALRAEGCSFRDIGKRVNMSKSRVQRLWAKQVTVGNMNRTIGSGRKRKTTTREDRLIIREVNNNRFITSDEIKLAIPTLQVSKRTICSRIHELGGFKSHVAAKKPFLKDKDIKKRLTWAQQHINWTPAQWQSVIFSDESPFTLRYEGRRKVWRRDNERFHKKCTVGTIKHDKRINVWGCFAYHGVGTLSRIIGNMNADMYVKILDNDLRASATKLFGNQNWIFQQDNDPKHTSKKCKDYLATYNFNVLQWPAYSPDLNPIENLWRQLNHQCKHRQCNDEIQLFNTLENAWKNIPVDRLNALVDSMPSRCQAVIDSRGGPTKY